MAFVLRFQIPQSRLETVVAAFAPHFPEYSLFRSIQGFWHYQSFCPKKPDGRLIDSLHMLTQFAQAQHDEDSPFIYHIEPLAQKDWLCENIKSLKNFSAGGFLIAPGGGQMPPCEYPMKQYLIKIAGSLAFGTGTHATTQLCLKTLLMMKKKSHPFYKRAFRLNDSPPIHQILDMGTGTGILAMAAGKLFKNAHIDALDISAESVAIAKNNVHVNLLAPRNFCVRKTNGTTLTAAKKYDLVMANILEKPLTRLQKSFDAVTKKNGLLLLSGFLDGQIPNLHASYSRHFTLLKKQRYGIWAALLYQRK